MPSTSELRKKRAIRPLIATFISGLYPNEPSANPFIALKPLLAQQILLDISAGPKTAEDIALGVGTDVVYVSDFLDQMQALQLVTSQSKGHYELEFPLIAGRLKQRLTRCFREHSEREAAIITEEMPGLRKAYAQCSFTDQGFDWDWMQWVIMPIFVVQAIARMSPEQYKVEYPARPGGYNYFFFGIEGPYGFNFKWKPGCNIYWDEKAGAAHFWSPYIKKVSQKGFNEERKAMLQLAEGPQHIKHVIADLDTDDPQTMIAEMLKLDYLTNQEDMLALNFPMVQPEDEARLLPVLDHIGQRVVNESRLSAYEVFGRLLDDPKIGLNFSFLGEDYKKQTQNVLCNDIAGCSIGAMVKNGLVANPPKTAPANWGFFGWIGRSSLMKSTLEPVAKAS